MRVECGSPYNPGRSDPCDIQVVRCLRCGTIRLNPRPDDRSLKRLQENALGDAESEVGSFEAGNTNTYYPSMLSGTLRRCGFPEARGRLLDIGCGSGDLLAAVCEHLNASGTGLEMAEGSLGRARKRFPNLEWILGRATASHIPTSTFDAVTLIHVLEHFTEPLEALRTTFQRLKPGGLLVVEVPNGEFYLSRTYSVLFEAPKTIVAPFYRLRKQIVPFTARGFYPYHLTLFGPRTLGEMVKKAGFSIVQRGFATSRLEFWLEQNKQEGRWVRFFINKAKLGLARAGLGDNLFLVARRPLAPAT